MSVSKNEKTGNWDVRVWYRDITGERRQTTKRGFRTKKEAQTYETDFLLKQQGQLDMKFGDFVDLYLDEIGSHIRSSTMETKENIVNTKILPYFEDRKIQDIRAVDIKRWQAKIGKLKNKQGTPYSQDYLRTINNTLSAIFNYAVNVYGLSGNPVRRAGGMGKQINKVDDYWTKDEYLKFSEQIAQHTEYFYAFEVLYWTGIRKSELLALTPADFDLEHNTLRINKQRIYDHKDWRITEPKTAKSYRTIVIPRFLADEIRQYLELLYEPSQDELIFNFGRSDLNGMIKRGAAAAGLKRIDVHGLRHSHVSLLINNGFNALAIGDRVGHEAQEITYRYAHLFNEAQKKMASALDQEMEEMFNG